MKNFLILPLLVLLLAACSDDQVRPCHRRSCIDTKIKQIEAQPVTSPATKVYSYQYNGQTVYYFTAHCCDMMSEVYDENCNFICSPDGGFSGKGDGTRPDFFEKATNKKLVWEDTRTK